MPPSSSAAPKKHISTYKPYIRPLSSLKPSLPSYQALFKARVDALLDGSIAEAPSGVAPVSTTRHVVTIRTVHFANTDGYQKTMEVAVPAPDVSQDQTSLSVQTEGGVFTFTEGKKDFFPERVRVASPPAEGKKTQG